MGDFVPLFTVKAMEETVLAKIKTETLQASIPRFQNNNSILRMLLLLLFICVQ